MRPSAKQVWIEFGWWLMVLTLVMLFLTAADFAITTDWRVRWVIKHSGLIFGISIAGLLILIGWLIGNIRASVLFKSALFFLAAIFIGIAGFVVYRLPEHLHLKTYDVTGMMALMMMGLAAFILVVLGCVYFVIGLFRKMQEEL